MQKGDWIDHFKVTVKRAEERPDQPGGDIVYRLTDLFTTRDGSWEPQPGHMGSIPQWARDKYLRPSDADDYFDDAGGDTHLFARVLDLDGKPLIDRDLICYWSDGFHQLGNPNYKGYTLMTPKEKSGWANLAMSDGSGFVPERNEHGPWCWCPQGAADVVVGGGLPANHHISYFAVWQAERRGVASPPADQPEQQGEGHSPSSSVVVPPSGDLDADLADAVRAESWRQTGVAYNRGSSFADHARQHGLGAPLTNEYNIGNIRAQGFTGGIVYARIGDWHNIQHMTW